MVRSYKINIRASVVYTARKRGRREKKHFLTVQLKDLVFNDIYPTLSGRNK